MNQNTGGVPTPTPTPAPTPAPQMPEEHKSSAGPIIGSIIIVLIIVLGGLYLYGDKVGLPSNQDQMQNTEEITADQISAQVDTVAEELNTQGTTDAIDEIESDLSATDLNALDAELSNISAELSF